MAVFRLNQGCWPTLKRNSWDRNHIEIFVCCNITTPSATRHGVSSGNYRAYRTPHQSYRMLHDDFLFFFFIFSNFDRAEQHGEWSCFHFVFCCCFDQTLEVISQRRRNDIGVWSAAGGTQTLAFYSVVCAQFRRVSPLSWSKFPGLLMKPIHKRHAHTNVEERTNEY